MRYVPPILALVALFVLLLLLARWGWRRRGRRQVDLPAPAALGAPTAAHDAVAGGTGDPAGAATGTAVPPLPGVYVCTTEAGRPLERIVAHGLGVRSRVFVGRSADGSFSLDREGSPSFTIPAADITEVTTSPGMVGKFVGGDGLLLVRWRLGERELDTGIRLDRRADHDLLLRPPGPGDAPPVRSAPAPTPDHAPPSDHEESS